LKNRLLAKDSGSIDTTIFRVCLHPDAWNRLKGPAKKRETLEVIFDNLIEMDYSEDEMNMDGVDEVEPIIEPKKLPKH
jgi:hypothetical protein